MTDLEIALDSIASPRVDSLGHKLAEAVGSQHEEANGKSYTCGGLFAGIGGFCFGF